jgi:hypothetical protein
MTDDQRLGVSICQTTRNGQKLSRPAKLLAIDISINAASQADITRASIGNAIAKLAKDGGKIAQDAIADLADVSQGWVSKFFAGLGGWRVWRKIITSCLKVLIQPVII